MVYYLVGGIPTPLKRMMTFPPEWKHKIPWFQTTNQYYSLLLDVFAVACLCQLYPLLSLIDNYIDHMKLACHYVHKPLSLRPQMPPFKSCTSLWTRKYVCLGTLGVPNFGTYPRHYNPMTPVCEAGSPREAIKLLNTLLGTNHLHRDPSPSKSLTKVRDPTWE